VTWKSLLAVALGGAVGALARLGLDLALFPNNEVSLAVVNLSGALLLGLAIGHGIHQLPGWLRDGITSGFLGSFTTMSGLAVLGIITPIGFSLVYISGTFLAGVGLAALGYHLGRSRSGKRA
jgi:fluoride exporter